MRNLMLLTLGLAIVHAMIDEVAIYNASLSATQVQQHFKASGR